MSRKQKQIKAPEQPSASIAASLSAVGGGEEVATREPEVATRDPVICSSYFEVPHMPGVTLVKGKLGACMTCGCGTFRRWMPSNPSYETGHVEHPKKCPWCNRKYIVVEPPSEIEIKNHWKNANANQR